MKKFTFKLIGAMLALAFVLLSISSCWVNESYNTRDAFKDKNDIDSTDGTVLDTTETVTAEPETVTETETEAETETETEPETEVETETSDGLSEGEIVIEEDIFGNYVPPETTSEEPEYTESTAVPTVSYTPSYPTSNGIAPIAFMYHLILDEPYSSLESLFVRPSELEGQIQALTEAGYTFIFADEYDRYDKKTVIMSFDDGYLDNYTEMFPIIKKYNAKVTVFMISAYIGGADYLTKDMIREMSASGLVSFQSHTHRHINVTAADNETLRNEFETSKREIKDLTGREVKALCYPTGAYNQNAMAVASEYFDFAYTTVSAVSTAGYDLMSLPRFRVSRGLSKGYFASILP